MASEIEALPGLVPMAAGGGGVQHSAKWRYGAAVGAFKAARRAVAAIVTVLATMVGGVGPTATATAAAAMDPVRLMVLGDSLTAGYGLAQTDGFVPRLEAALRGDGYDVRVINAGVSGDTSAGGLARLPWLLDGPPADQPDAVMVELGGNDGLRGLDPDAMEKNLGDVLSLLDDRGLPVLLTGMKAPPNLGAEYGLAFETVFHRLADAYDIPLYGFFLDGVAAVPTLNQPDGIHPNAAGVNEIVRRILPATKALLDNAIVSDAAMDP